MRCYNTCGGIYFGIYSDVGGRACCCDGSFDVFYFDGNNLAAYQESVYMVREDRRAQKRLTNETTGPKARMCKPLYQQ